MIGFANLQGKKILLLRSEIASDELAGILKKAKAVVTEQPVYTIEPQKNETKLLTEKINQGQVDWLTFASPSSVDSFFGQIRADLVNSSKVQIASIGPVTSRALKGLGIMVDVESTEHTIDGLLSAIESMY